MAAGFSGAIKLAEMNDYLALNQACIKPAMKKEEDAAKDKVNTRGAVAFEFSASDARDLRFPGLQASGGAFSSVTPSVGAGDASVSAPGHFDQMKMDAVKKTASVSLNDCLACSGCVTSAETVLITQQSTQELLNVLDGNAAALQAPPTDAMAAATAAPSATPKRSVVVSISPQSLTALAHEFKLTPLVCAKKLTTFFVRELGCLALVDTTPALDIALIEAQEEFVARYRWNQAQLDGRAAAPAVAASATCAAPSVAVSTSSSPHANTVSPSSASPLPILTSECPGWVCYCEKTQSVETLSHMSSVRSGQAIMGALLKQWWCPLRGLAPDSLFHAAIMPCYDKKLEASRSDFFLDQWSTRETDCVLTTGEVAELLKQKGFGDLGALEESPLDADFFNVTPDQTALYRSVDVGGSGGYCEALFRHAARKLFGVQYAPSDALPYQAGRNSDFRELTLVHRGKVVLNFALAFGFRNIQNLVRKMKTKRPGKIMLPADAIALEEDATAAAATSAAGHSPSAEPAASVSLPTGSGGYHYVEVMACPSGCLNGGGQVKAADIRSQKQLVLDLDALFHQREVCQPEDNVIVQRIYREWLQGSTPYTGLARLHLHTQYHSVEKDAANPLGIKW